MDTARISALLGPFVEESLPASQLDQISTYIDLLKRWNTRVNLTAIRNEDEIVSRHFGESLFMARHLFPNSRIACCPERTDRPALSLAPTQLHILDIGSGAGFPAIPLKIWASHIHLTMIESNHKKAAFLREVSRTLTLTDINVSTDRAEVLANSQDFPRAQVVTLRAVDRFETILPQAGALVAPDGRLALLIGVAQIPHLAALTAVEWHPAIPVPQSHARVLSIGIRSQSGNDHQQ